MDRELPRHVTRRERVRRVSRIAVPLAGLLIGIALLPDWLRPAIARTRIRTAVVTSGVVDAVVQASGTVVPELERVLVSPVEAQLLRVLKRPGMTVAAGDAVAELDLSESEVAWQRLATEVRIAENEASKAHAALARELAELDGRIERTALNVELLSARASGQERLFAEGLASEQASREARMAERQAAIELAQLRRERAHAERAAALDEAGLLYERDALRQQTAHARRVLELGTMRSDRDGVVTWVLAAEGSMVRRGETVARIADLGSFRVQASASDVHAARIRPGTPVLVSIGADVRLDGSITDVAPSVEGGVVRFEVRLRESAHPRLRPDLTVDVLVIAERKAGTLRVQRGPFDDGSDRVQAFVIRDGRAVRQSVRLGIRGASEVEILSGLARGDQVIVSDMRDYLHLEEVEVR